MSEKEPILHNGALAKLSMAVALLSVVGMIVSGLAAKAAADRNKDFVTRGSADRFTLSDAQRWCDEFRRIHPDLEIPDPTHE